MISIILPVRNEANFIKKSLNSILAQDYPQHQIEILIADGMSTDNTREIVRAYQTEHPNIYLIENTGKIVPTGMNLALRQAKGDIIIRVDGHCIIATDYINKCVDHLSRGGIDGVGGPMHTIGEDFTSEVIALAMSSKFGVGNSSFRTETGQSKSADTVPFPAYTRAIIEKVGLYDEELVRNQDDEYNYRIREAGGKILLADDVRSTYFSRGSFQKLWKQYFQYGYWKVRVLQKHPKQMSLRQFVPPLFVFSLLLALLLSFTLSWGWTTLAGLIGVYLAANLIASFLTAKTKGFRYFWPLPLAFAIIHVSYGLGLLTGLFKFWNRWNDRTGKVPSINLSS